MVSPLMARPKSGTDAAALKTAAALEKSRDVMSGLIFTLSMMLMSGPMPLFSAASSDSFAEEVGMSPESLMSFPLRPIDTAARDSAGIVGVFGAPAEGLGPARGGFGCIRRRRSPRRPGGLASGAPWFAIADDGH